MTPSGEQLVAGLISEKIDERNRRQSVVAAPRTEMLETDLELIVQVRSKPEEAVPAFCRTFVSGVFCEPLNFPIGVSGQQLTAYSVIS